MFWAQIDAYHLVSDCRCFTIAKFFIRGEAFYEVWQGRELLVTRLPSADAAKAHVAALGPSQIELGLAA